MPVNFSLDAKTKLADPIGQVGKELSVDIHVLTGNNATVQNIINCVTNCYLQVAGINFSPYLSGLSTLTEDELHLGAVCIDFGGGTTGLSIFFEKQLIYADGIRIGGCHITSDIMQAFQITEEIAERLKTLHGGAPEQRGRIWGDFSIEAAHDRAGWRNAIQRRCEGRVSCWRVGGRCR